MTDLLVATTRQRDKKGVAGFNGERVDGVDFAAVSLSVPLVSLTVRMALSAASPSEIGRAHV